MTDTSDLFNPPRSRLNLLRHPVLLVVLGLACVGVGHFLYRLIRPVRDAVPTVAKPNGDWIGEITMDGRDWRPTINGDTPGPHRHAVFHFTLATTDSFLDHHAGNGSMRIVRESITRSFRAYGWQLNPDGSFEFGISSTPTLFADTFQCEVDGSNIACKPNGPMGAILSMHPGSPEDANRLLQQITSRAAAEAPLTPLPTTHEEVLCSDAYETQSVTVADNDPKYQHKPGKKQKRPPPCNHGDED